MLKNERRTVTVALPGKMAEYAIKISVGLERLCKGKEAIKCKKKRLKILSNDYGIILCSSLDEKPVIAELQIELEENA